MKCRCKIAAVFLLVLVMVVPLSFGCGGGGGGKVTITIGELTDFTGIAAPAVKTITYITQDIARYYNDENLIPGVKVKIAAYDTQYDPSRIVPGYDWCKNQGAKVIITLFPGDPDVLKPFAETDKVIIAAMGVNPEAFDPPGWVFGFSNANVWATKTLLKWISDNDWDYGQGISKIGMAAWNDPLGVLVDKATKEYVQNHPGKFDYVGAYHAPAGTVIFAAEAKKLEDCDYVTSGGYPSIYLLRDLRAIGSKAKMIDGVSSMLSYKKLFVDVVGWEGVDGTLTTNESWYWNDSSPFVDLAKELLQRYRPSQAVEIMDAGGYVGPATQVIAIFEVLQQAIQKVGAENFDGQAYFDAAIDYKTTSPIWKGCPQWGFGQTKRYLIDHHALYEFSASEQDVVRITDWLPQLME